MPIAAADTPIRISTWKLGWLHDLCIKILLQIHDYWPKFPSKNLGLKWKFSKLHVQQTCLFYPPYTVFPLFSLKTTMFTTTVGFFSIIIYFCLAIFKLFLRSGHHYHLSLYSEFGNIFDMLGISGTGSQQYSESYFLSRWNLDIVELDIIHVGILGSYMVIINSLEAVLDLLKKRCLVYSSWQVSYCTYVSLQLTLSIHTVVPHGGRWHVSCWSWGCAVGGDCCTRKVSCWFSPYMWVFYCSLWDSFLISCKVKYVPNWLPRAEFKNKAK